jgi:hypothetical protein
VADNVHPGGSYVCGDALDAQGNTLLTGSWRNEHALQLWDYGSGRLLTNLPFNQPQSGACLVYGARFGPANSNMKRFIAAGGSGNKPCLRMYHQVLREQLDAHELTSCMASEWLTLSVTILINICTK